MKYNFLFTLMVILLCFTACTSGNTTKSDAQHETKLEEGEQIAQTGIKVDPQNLATTNDVVCGMSLKNSVIADTAVIDGKIYPFCAADCKKAFMADIVKYKIN